MNKLWPAIFYFSISIKAAFYCVTCNSFMSLTKEVGLGERVDWSRKTQLLLKLKHWMTSCHSTLCSATTTLDWKLTTATEKGKGKTTGENRVHLTSEILAFKFIHELH